MAKGDLFSTVLRGFHKEQVSQYLNDLIRKYEREKEELNKKYEGISPNVVQELRQENDRLRRELEQEKNAQCRTGTAKREDFSGSSGGPGFRKAAAFGQPDQIPDGRGPADGTGCTPGKRTDHCRGKNGRTDNSQ